MKTFLNEEKHGFFFITKDRLLLFVHLAITSHPERAAFHSRESKDEACHGVDDGASFICVRIERDNS